MTEQQPELYKRILANDPPKLTQKNRHWVLGPMGAAFSCRKLSPQAPVAMVSCVNCVTISAVTAANAPMSRRISLFRMIDPLLGTIYAPKETDMQT